MLFLDKKVCKNGCFFLCENRNQALAAGCEAPAADEYLRFFNKKTCNFSHFLFKRCLYLLQKYLQHVTEPWILVIWLIHPACSMMINILAMTSNDKYNGPSSVGQN